ncbi:MAG: hypothetical protein CO105_15700 [Comamonadaceae bacterium CG_4_9_14_3_um_filter_60_33]|nr:MAG: hypothetical protein CO105_15700 [Comamonadaceae bacterium CG_4_9_14_3_um_filter_60_33]
MSSLEQFADDRLAHGRLYFTRAEVLASLALLRAAAFHGSSHQAAMVFQVIVPRQLRGFEMGRHRLAFIYQAPKVFALANQAYALDHIKSDTGFANVAGVELTLLEGKGMLPFAE